jgi:HAD superfamily hydrolase (TIGR01509 family)
MPAALFDVDGTLVDTPYLHTVLWWHAFERGGHLIPMARIHRAIGMGSDNLVPYLLDRTPSDDEYRFLRDGHDALFRTYWSSLRPLPGAADLLRACAARGLTVVLASSAGKEELVALRRAVDADDVIAAATSADDVEVSKPAADIVEAALRLGGSTADDSVFVGDTVWDVRAAQRVGVACVALTCGGISAADLRAEGAVEVYADPGELCRKLDDSILARRSSPGLAGRSDE